MRRVPLLVAAAAVAILWLVYSGIGQAAVFFRFPSELTAEALTEIGGERIRVGGLVEAGSLSREGAVATFVLVDDGPGRVAVLFEGLVPDLFAEGTGAVVEGSFGPDGTFVADTLMVKHGEDYGAEEGHPDKEGMRDRFGTGVPSAG